ncbi:MAG: thiamine phosphate synthase [Hyphomonadaceae bacterium]|nr:thiamine phosphate synthase [Hyphomonadaceae bacterium]
MLKIAKCQIYLITPPQIHDLDMFADTLENALKAGPVACLQIRLKNTTDTGLLHVTNRLSPTCRAHDTLILINDRPDLAKVCRADGVHIGQGDMDCFSSRKLLDEGAIIGVTCHNSRELAFKAAGAGADYVAFGAFFDTPTKSPGTWADVEILQWWSETVEVPCVAIGGITVKNARTIIETGAAFIAVSSGVWAHPDGPGPAVSQLHQLCLEHSPS